MVVIWTLAVGGIIFKIFFLHRFHNLSLALYLGMGWLAVLASYELLANLPGSASPCCWAAVFSTRWARSSTGSTASRQPRHLAPLCAGGLRLPFPGCVFHVLPV